MPVYTSTTLGEPDKSYLLIINILPPDQTHRPTTALHCFHAVIPMFLPHVWRSSRPVTSQHQLESSSNHLSTSHQRHGPPRHPSRASSTRSTVNNGRFNTTTISPSELAPSTFPTCPTTSSRLATAGQHHPRRPRSSNTSSSTLRLHRL